MKNKLQNKISEWVPIISVFGVTGVAILIATNLYDSLKNRK